jgi:hypothetical protein
MSDVYYYTDDNHKLVCCNENTWIPWDPIEDQPLDTEGEVYSVWNNNGRPQPVNSPHPPLPPRSPNK